MRTTSQCVEVAGGFVPFRLAPSNSPTVKPSFARSMKQLFFFFIFNAPGSIWLSTHTMILLSLLLTCNSFIRMCSLYFCWRRSYTYYTSFKISGIKTPGGRKPRLYPHHFIFCFLFWPLLLLSFLSFIIIIIITWRPVCPSQSTCRARLWNGNEALLLLHPSNW